MTTYLVTGGAGFIGSHLVEALLRRGEQVVCLDNFTTYYDPRRKRRNLAWAETQTGFQLVEADLRDAQALAEVFATHRPRYVAHLAALPGPRPSIANPALYTQVNVTGSIHLLELIRQYNIENLMLASTSSVYGRTEKVPFEECDPTDRPLSPYAATKKAAEVLAYTFHSLYGIPTSIIRFFTVYGPRGRPDMTPYLFVDRMVRGEPIVLFNNGVELYRDYTYVDDIVAGIMAALDRPQPFEIFNVGNAKPIEMHRFVELIETITGLQAQIENRPLPATEPLITFANSTKAERMLGFQSQTTVEVGLERFWAWYQQEVANVR
ncbi:NAD-dependent epimerase/dehydratase family protein [Candidatus Viridilinea mediisalina]|uniref:Epimerase n=1 Tax=Candidatus Viridilinea mediisalina TaxID=2024553 RepID=A0A2A6RJ07_9CHLR|nr:NAD-dependent epimerase/dehydratase family protein [Candidatus Viridilinea mediisalina]PDW02933.1 epimerase [Candidatus Viridilinea mediisalina]